LALWLTKKRALWPGSTGTTRGGGRRGLEGPRRALDGRWRGLAVAQLRRERGRATRGGKRESEGWEAPQAYPDAPGGDGGNGGAAEREIDGGHAAKHGQRRWHARALGEAKRRVVAAVGQGPAGLKGATQRAKPGRPRRARRGPWRLGPSRARQEVGEELTGGPCTSVVGKGREADGGELGRMGQKPREKGGKREREGEPVRRGEKLAGGEKERLAAQVGKRKEEKEGKRGKEIGKRVFPCPENKINS
jgi:hypothetical protein